ncbi:hypothetical protein Ahy_B06g084734 isoform A [Arachis hypogaea]|uniref:Uncharacterized protein n=1 Tax=Arachis hypogaea TaxID=3818 RepID=A0A444YSM3_ARAHY|nr:hypothetical protein Ahy_B06g084734 isoform A [Arachis hypogaea]
MDAVESESSHGSQPADAPLLPPIVRFALNNNACTQMMTNVIKLIFFVQLNFIWDKEHDLIIREIYDHRMGRRLQQMLEDVHERHGHLTSWFHSEIKKALSVHWETDEGFKHRLLINGANRASARSSKYTGGSATFMKTKARMSKLLDRDATLAETFKYTHTLKENKARFAYQWSVDHYESYTQRLEATTQQYQQSGEDTSGSVASVVDPAVVWRETDLVPYKNRIYGLGSFLASSLRTSTSTSATS